MFNQILKAKKQKEVELPGKELADNFTDVPLDPASPDIPRRSTIHSPTSSPLVKRRTTFYKFKNLLNTPKTDGYEQQLSPQIQRKKAVYTGRVMVPDGFQTYYWESGDRYDGYWKKNTKHGYGVMRWNNGDCYQGVWQKDKRHDVRGRYSYAHGVTYEGGFNLDRREGQGCLIWPDGDRFFGTWKNGARCGPGLLITSLGREIKQEWNESEDVNYSESIPAKYPEGSLPAVGYL